MFNFNLNKKNILSNFKMHLGNNRSSRNSRYIGDYEVVKQDDILEFLKDDIFILDVRTEKEFKGIRVKNAINLPLMILSREIGSIVLDKDTKILIYCSTGERAMLAIQKLNSLGYKNLYIWGNGGLNTLKCKDILEY